MYHFWLISQAARGERSRSLDWATIMNPWVYFCPVVESLFDRWVLIVSTFVLALQDGSVDLTRSLTHHPQAAQAQYNVIPLIGNMLYFQLT
jgi:hypothetical protein